MIKVLLLFIMPLVAFAAEIRDARLQCSAKQCAVEFVFDREKDLPGFKQNLDRASGVWSVFFSRTRTVLEKKNYTLDPKSIIKAVEVSEDATPGGVPMLKFSFQVASQVTSDRNPTELKGNVFRILLPADRASKPWKLSDPKFAKENLKKTQTEKSAPVAKAEIKPTRVPPPEKTENLALASGKAGPIQELGWIRGAGQEQFYLRFSGKVGSLLATGNQADLVFEGEQVPSVNLPVGGSKVLSKAVLVSGQNGGKLQLTLKPGTHIIQRPGRLLIQGDVPRGVPLESWAWNGTKAQGTTRRYTLGTGDDDLIATPDSFAAQRADEKPISTRNVFTVQPDSRELIVVEDQVALLKQPTEASERLASLVFGQHLQSMGLTGIFYRVRMGEVVGFVNRRLVSYQDEMSQAHAERFRVMQAKQTAEQQGENAQGAAGLQFEEVIEDKIIYSSFGRRDPFINLDGPSTDGINIDGVELVGIIWESETPMVLLADARNPGVSYTLKEGDKIMNGKVLKITPEEVLFLINEFGVSRRYTMTLPDRNTEKRGTR